MTVPASQPGRAKDFGQTGFRIPSTVDQPVDAGRQGRPHVYDHTSIIKFVSDNWGLPT